jgi:hypothetical protein
VPNRTLIITPLDTVPLGFTISGHPDLLSALDFDFVLSLTGLRNIGQVSTHSDHIAVRLRNDRRVHTQRSALLAAVRGTKRLLRAKFGHEINIDDSAMPPPHRRPPRKVSHRGMPHTSHRRLGSL